jgi:hypothetical protein
MDCLDAQAAISEALDGAPSDADALATAREHCQECDECLSFVRALTVVKRAPLPEPPADLADRVMAAVRAEAVAASAGAAGVTAAANTAGQAPRAAETAAAASAGPASSPPHAAGGAPSAIPISTRLKQTRPRVLAAWASAAAVLLVGIGVTSVLGIRMMTTPPATTTATLGSAPRNDANSDQAQPQAAESAAGSVAKTVPAVSESDFIVFNGSAYQLVGPSTVQISKLSQLGITKSSLEGSDVRNRQVMGANGMESVYVLNDLGKLLEFKPVTRKYAGQTYQLKSGEVPAFGEWPVLPADIAEPTSEDGSPTFMAVGADPGGITVYQLTASTATKGIALAPGAPEGDAVAGSPNWSWWAPAQ